MYVFKFLETSRPVSSLLGDLGIFGSPPSTKSKANRQSLTSSTSMIDPDHFTFASVDTTGHTLQLSGLGVSLVIPEGSLEPGFTEEIFLAVTTDDAGRDRPRLASNQTLLSPVVLVGPPRLTFKKPVILNFGHCANNSSSWELGLYHCDSLFFSTGGQLDDDEDAPWVKLVTIGQDASLTSPVLASMETDSCCVMTDFLSRFCIVGQSASPDVPASKVLRILILGKPISSSLDYCLCVHVIENTDVAFEKAAKTAEKHGFGLMDVKLRTFNIEDGSGDLVVSLSDCAPGWSLKPAGRRSSGKQKQVFTFNQIWSSGNSKLRANYSLTHVDPTVSSIAFKLTAFQTGSLERTALTFNVNTDAGVRLGSIPRNIGTTSSNVSSSGVSVPVSPFKFPSPLRYQLCTMLNSPQAGQNDWRALSAGLRLEKFNQYFSARSSPTECILGLWEVQRGVATIEKGAEAITDLLNLLRVIGRQDCAALIEKEYGPWL